MREGATIIASPGNARVKLIRSLLRREGRERTGLYFLEGLQLVTEAVQLGAAIRTLVVAPALLKSALGREIVGTVRPPARLEVTPAVFRTLSSHENPQGIAAVVEQRWQEINAVRPEAGLCWIALGSVCFPGNLGSVLRTSEAVGGAGVILLGHSTDPYDPLSVRASMGAILSQRIVRTDLCGLVDWAGRNRCPIVGTSPSAATDYRLACYGNRPVVLIGNEQHGLSPEEQRACARMVRIPMVGRCDSLNLAVAASLILYEVFDRQRSAPLPADIGAIAVRHVDGAPRGAIDLR